MFNRSRQVCTPASTTNSSMYNFHGGNVGNRGQGSTTLNRVGSMAGRIYGSQPHGMQQQMNSGNQFQRSFSQNQNGGGMGRARSTPGLQMQSHEETEGQTSGMRAYPTTGGIAADIQSNPNVQYVRMNWEDILGGKNGLQGLQVSMSPATGDPNANRQIRIGMGGAEGASANDGSTPLRIRSFQPVENYPGRMDPTPTQAGQPKFTVFTGTAPPSASTSPAPEASQQGSYAQGWSAGGYASNLHGHAQGQGTFPRGNENVYCNARR